MTKQNSAVQLPPPLIEGVPSVAIGACSLSAVDVAKLGSVQGRDVFVYGAKIPAPQRDYPDAWCMHYCLREVLDDGTVLEHHLAQRDSVVYCPEGCGQDPDECADMVRPADIPCLKVRPRWQWSDATIPMTADGRLMTFVWQCSDLVEGYALFCFASATADGQGLLWKLFDQDMSEQTAEAHYRLEEQIAEFDRHGGDRAVVQRLLAACRQLGGCATGQAKMTRAYRLPCRHVIHTVGPVWRGGAQGEADLLRACYTHSLDLAVQHGLKTLAFPCISTGVYDGYPADQAAPIAVAAVRQHPGVAALDQVIFCCFGTADLALYQRLL